MLASQISKSLGVLGTVSAKELTYRYDMVDVAQDEDNQLRKSVEKTPDKVEKSELLRRFQRTHSQSSLDISVDTEQKATKTLDKIQMIRKAIHNVEETLELEEEKIEEIRKQRFIVPRQQQNTTEVTERRHHSSDHEVDIRNLPRGLLKHLCRMLDEGPRCAWREIVPLLGMGHRLSELESSIDSPTGELINMWVTENLLVTFSDFCEVLRLAELPQVLDFVTRHAQLKKRLSKQSLVFYPME